MSRGQSSSSTAAALRGQRGRTGPPNAQLFRPGGNAAGLKEERNGSTVEPVKIKLTKLWPLKLFPLHRGMKQGGFPYLGILHQAGFIPGSGVQKHIPSSFF